MSYIKKALILIFVAITFFFFFLLLLSRLLFFEKRIDANYLLVEGWVPQEVLRTAAVEFHSSNYDYLLITGGLLEGPISLNVNGFLIYRLTDILKNGNFEETNTFLINATSSLGQNDSAHFVFWINDWPVNDFYTAGQNEKIRIDLNGNLSEVDSIMIQFDNDMFSGKKDRNLLIKEISLNGTVLNSKNSGIFMDIGTPFGADRMNYTANSYSDFGANFFIDMGIDSTRVFPITNYFEQKRKTYGNALALKEWLTEGNMDVIRINVVTTHYHSRRTWMTYKKTLAGKARVGVIPVEESRNTFPQENKNLTITKETFALLYYLIFVFPFI
jgi:hypothetical protein